MINENKPFRELDLDFLKSLESGKLKYILQFERKNRKSFMIEIRNNFLDLYFLGHTIEVRRRKDIYYLVANETFNPKELLSDHLKCIVKKYESEYYMDKSRKWCISFEDIKEYKDFEDIMIHTILKIVEHRRGSISECVSEINHFIDNRDIKKNGILIIDRQVVYPGSAGHRIDLLGIRRLNGNEYTFVVIELKNKNNTEIGQVFSQTKRYIDMLYSKYEHYRITYQKVLEQKIKLGLLKRNSCRIAASDKITKKDLLGLVVLDNYNIRSDLKNINNGGLLHRAINDWRKVGSEYSLKLFMKTNILDSTFFMDLDDTVGLLDRFKRNNL
jgi:hypothetical protein